MTENNGKEKVSFRYLKIQKKLGWIHMKQTKTYKMVLAAIFMAIGMVLPFLTAQLPSIGNMLLPMHIPVLLCGFICGAPYGCIVGLIVPLLRSATMGMPPMFPTGIAMAFELAIYGFVTGFMYKRMRHGIVAIYVSLLSAMMIGRVAWGVVRLVLAGVSGSTFTAAAFLAGAFTTAIPGIILQLILIPIIIAALERAGFLKE